MIKWKKTKGRHWKGRKKTKGRNWENREKEKKRVIFKFWGYKCNREFVQESMNIVSVGSYEAKNWFSKSNAVIWS